MAFYELSPAEQTRLREEGLSEVGLHELKLVLAKKQVVLLEEARARGEQVGFASALRRLQADILRGLRLTHPFFSGEVVPFTMGSWTSAYVLFKQHSGTGEFTQTVE